MSPGPEAEPGRLDGFERDMLSISPYPDRPLSEADKQRAAHTQEVYRRLADEVGGQSVQSLRFPDYPEGLPLINPAFRPEDHVVFLVRPKSQDKECLR